MLFRAAQTARRRGAKEGDDKEQTQEVSWAILFYAGSSHTQSAEPPISTKQPYGAKFLIAAGPQRRRLTR